MPKIILPSNTEYAYVYTNDIRVFTIKSIDAILVLHSVLNTKTKRPD